MSYLVFERMPQISTLLALGRQTTQLAFLEYVHTQALSHDWVLPVRYLNWLLTQKTWQSQIVSLHIKEALFAAVTGWSLLGMDYLGCPGIVLASQYLPDEVVGLWKSQAPERPHELFVARVASGRHPARDAYALPGQYASLAGLEWLALP